MSRIHLARGIGVLLLILAVAAPLAAAPIPRPRQATSEAVFPLSTAWRWLLNVWAKNGCMIDPHGSCLPGTGSAAAPPPGTDNGCAIDPGGRCNSAASADNGCGIDPHGSCHPG